MYAIIKYFNYRKDMSLQILKVVSSFKQANRIAKFYAEQEFGDDYTEGVEDERLVLQQAEIQYTQGDGYSSYVFAVVELPKEEDEDKTEDETETYTESD
jgi:hypothetical protein